jgi:hypothetical protein
LEIVQEGGLNPIILGTADAAAALDNRGAQFKGDAKEYSNLEELAAQCSRALRNLSVNRKWNMIYIYSLRISFDKFLFTSQKFRLVSVCRVLRHRNGNDKCLSAADAVVVAATAFAVVAESPIFIL